MRNYEFEEDEVRDMTEAEDIVSSRAYQQALIDFSDVYEKPNSTFFCLGESFKKAHPRQRGYIHGLSKKLDIDDEVELPYVVNDVRKLTVSEAADVISILKEMYESQDAMF